VEGKASNLEGAAKVANAVPRSKLALGGRSTSLAKREC